MKAYNRNMRQDVLLMLCKNWQFSRKGDEEVSKDYHAAMLEKCRDAFRDRFDVDSMAETVDEAVWEFLQRAANSK